ncbi:MAG: hypothetical protein D6819_01665 [Gammaproteobacteria bacterium]|nr:MAG: hypothetical protein D6819_01665 [Gammaproteobacteria bacterium]
MALALFAEKGRADEFFVTKGPPLRTDAKLSPVQLLYLRNVGSPVDVDVKEMQKNVIKYVKERCTSLGYQAAAYFSIDTQVVPQGGILVSYYTLSFQCSR